MSSPACWAVALAWQAASTSPLVETGLAVEAFIWPNTQRDEYLLRIGAIPTPGTTLEQLEEALMAQLNKLAREEASPEELAKVKKASRKSRLLGADSQMSLVSKICEMEVASSWGVLSRLRRSD
jgi:predicted Zn-dependent peptidase